MVKLVEPNYGRVVTFEVVSEEPLRQMAIGMLIAVSNCDTIKSIVFNNTVTLKFSDENLASAFRNAWMQR